MILTMQLTRLDQQLECTHCEEDWIEAAKAGDLDAFNSIVSRYQDGLYRIACGIFGNEAMAGDAVQDTFISAFRHLQSFRNGSFKSWLIRILVNKCGDQLRSAHQRRMVSFSALTSQSEDEYPASVFEAKDTGLSVAGHLEAAELEEMIRSSLNELPANYRTIVVLSDIEELDYQDVANILQIPVGTVKSRLARARAKLRTILLQHGGLLSDKYVCE
jgi:RNA polymerase sigma-70 factor (ECF subfamily)